MSKNEKTSNQILVKTNPKVIAITAVSIFGVVAFLGIIFFPFLSNLFDFSESDCVSLSRKLLVVTEDTTICAGEYISPNGGMKQSAISIEADDVILTCEPGTIIRGNGIGFALTAIGTANNKLDNIEINGCRFEDYKSGMNIVYTNDSKITNNVIIDMDANSIAGSYNTDLELSNNTIGGETANGFNFKNDKNVVINSNDIGCSNDVRGRIVSSWSNYTAFNVSGDYIVENNKCNPTTDKNNMCDLDCDDEWVDADEDGCIDLDGGMNISEANCVRINGEEGCDYCIDSNTVFEYFCPQGPQVLTGYSRECPNGCEDGRCLPSETCVSRGGSFGNEDLNSCCDGLERMSNYGGGFSDAYLCCDASIGECAIDGKCVSNGAEVDRVADMINYGSWKCENGEVITLEREQNCWNIGERVPSDDSECCNGGHVVYSFDSGDHGATFPMCCGMEVSRGRDGMCPSDNFIRGEWIFLSEVDGEYCADGLELSYALSNVDGMITDISNPSGDMYGCCDPGDCLIGDYASGSSNCASGDGTMYGGYMCRDGKWWEPITN